MFGKCFATAILLQNKTRPRLLQKLFCSLSRKSRMSSYIPSEDEKEKFMARAIELSEEGAAKGCGGPFGSVVVKEGKIVG